MTMTTIPPAPPTAPQPEPPKPAPKRRSWIWLFASVLVVAAGATTTWFWLDHRADVAAERAAVEAAEAERAAVEAAAAQYEQDFDRLLTEIEELETINEQFVEDVLNAETEFFTKWNPDGSWTEFERLGGQWLDAAWDSVIALQTDVSPLIASLDAQQFDGELARVRNEAVAHYRAWLDWTQPYLDNVNGWVFVDTSTRSWDEYSRPELDPLGAEIDDTFRQLCRSLSDEQPDSGDFTARIAAECAD